MLVSQYFIIPLHRVWIQSLKSFTENTTPGSDVKVTTSVHLFFSLVRNCWAKDDLVTISKWEFLSTVSNRVDANCWYGWINALIWLSDAPILSHPLRASSCLLISLIPSLINKTSNSLWMTEISDLRNITITLLLTSFIDIFCDSCLYWDLFEFICFSFDKFSWSLSATNDDLYDVWSCEYLLLLSSSTALSLS